MTKSATCYLFIVWNLICWSSEVTVNSKEMFPMPEVMPTTLPKNLPSLDAVTKKQNLGKMDQFLRWHLFLRLQCLGHIFSPSWVGPLPGPTHQICSFGIRTFNFHWFVLLQSLRWWATSWHIHVLVEFRCTLHVPHIAWPFLKVAIDFHLLNV